MRFFIITCFLLSTTMLSGCKEVGPEEPRRVHVAEEHCATDAERVRVAKFVVDCSAAANPMSDEEGEDLVQRCSIEGQRLLCPIHNHVRIHSTDFTYTIAELESGKPVQ